MTAPTNQEIFNASWSGLKAQGFVKSRELYGHPESWRWTAFEAGQCSPRDDDRCCALQHVTNAAVLGRDMFDAPRDALAEICYHPDKPHSIFMRELMVCHNSATSPEDMERQLRECAAKYGVTIPGEDAKTDEVLFAAFKAKLLQPLAEAVL